MLGLAQPGSQFLKHCDSARFTSFRLAFGIRTTPSFPHRMFILLQEPSQCPSWWQLHRSLGFLEVVSRTQMPNITVPSFRCHSLPRLPCGALESCRLLFPPAPCLLDLRMLQVSVSAEDRGAQQAPGMVLRAANCMPLHSSTLLLPQGIGGVSDPPAYWPRICYGAFGGVRKLFEFSLLLHSQRGSRAPSLSLFLSPGLWTAGLPPLSLSRSLPVLRRTNYPEALQTPFGSEAAICCTSISPARRLILRLHDADDAITGPGPKWHARLQSCHQDCFRSIQGPPSCS